MRDGSWRVSGNLLAEAPLRARRPVESRSGDDFAGSTGARPAVLAVRCPDSGVLAGCLGRLKSVVQIGPRLKFSAAVSSSALTHLGIRMLKSRFGCLCRTRAFRFDEPVSEVLGVGARALLT